MDTCLPIHATLANGLVSLVRAGRVPCLGELVEYRGYDFEEKTLMVGWQITIRKDDVFVRNSKIAVQRNDALNDARAHVDEVIALADAKSL